jgi:acetylornithine deacetylase
MVDNMVSRIIGRPFFFMIKLLEKLVNISSISGNEQEVCRYLFHYLQDNGYETEQQPVARDSFNVLAGNGNRPRVILCSHMDTVAPFLPFRKQGDLIHGRGACDAKGQIVAMISAAARLSAENIQDFGLLFVVGEESTSCGAKKAAQFDLGSEFVIIGEPTDNKLAIGQKGVLAFELSAKGTGGHSSLPDLGESAVHKLLDVLYKWKELDWGADDVLGKSLINFGEISGGVGMNVLAPDATARGMFRIATSLSDIHEKIDATLPKDVQLRILSESGPQHMLTLPGFETQVVGFGTDAAHLRPMGDIILYGPGSIRVAHRDNEHIRISELEQAVDDYVKIVKSLLN